MYTRIRALLKGLLTKRPEEKRSWSEKTLVVGPFEPVDGDSVASTAALLDHLRRKGLEVYTLPVLAMYKQLDWILGKDDIHPAIHELTSINFTTPDLQTAYDKLLESWRPDEVVLVDGQHLGFDTRGVPVYIIDHHIKESESEKDSAGAFIKHAPSAGSLLIEHFGVVEPILAVSILTDTFWFRQNMPSEAVRHMARLCENGLDDELLAAFQKRLMVRKNTRILRSMQDSDMRFSDCGNAAFLVLKDSDPETHRGVMAELGYFCRHMCTVRADGYVSFRTVDERIDLRSLGEKYGKGGHEQMAAGEVDVGNPEAIEQLYKDFMSCVLKVEGPRSFRRC